MILNDLQKLLNARSKKAAEKSVGFDIRKDIWEATQALKKEYGKRVDEWPEMWLKILFPGQGETNYPPSQITKEGGAADDGGVPKQKDLKQGRRNKPQFHSLTEEDVEWITGVYNQESTSLEKYKKMFERFGIEARTSSWWWSKLGLTTKQAVPDFLKETANRTLTKQRFLITSAQNASPVHQRLWKNIQAYAKHIDAEILVVPTRYKNPTSVFQDLDHDFWAPELHPYLDTTRHFLSDNLVILGNLKVQPTAEFPLRGLNAITKGATAIIGHNKMMMESVPVLEGEWKQRLWSTGSVTIENFTDSKAGARGESHQIMGCLIIELDGDSHHIRHIPATDSGDFTDLWWIISDGEVGFSDEITAAVLGDVHLGDHSEGKINATVDMLNMLRPSHILLHDIHNGHSTNHHEAKDPVKLYHRILKGRNLIKDEVEQMLSWLHWFTQEFSNSKIVVVKSNHCEFINKYISEQNWRNDLPNASWYVKCLDYLLNNPDNNGLVAHFIEQEFGDRVTCLSRDTSYRPGTYQLANHGDLGASGSKGSPLQYSKLGTKQITGHTHSPARINGLLVAGTSTHLRLDYTKGPSSWAWADVIEYKNGKATHIIYDENFRFTTLKYPLYHG